MQIFLNQVASQIKLAGAVEKIQIILPTRRAATYLKNIYTQKRDSIFSLDEYIEMQFSTCGKIIDTTESVLQFYDVYRKSHENVSFDDFSSWAFAAVDDFNAIDNSLADAKDLYSYLSDSKAIELWNPQMPLLTATQEKYLFFFKQQFGHYELLTNHLSAQKLAYRGMANKWLAQNILNINDADRIYVVGFNAFNNAENELFRKLHQANKLEFIWDADSHYLNDVENEAGNFLRKNIDTFYKGNLSKFNLVVNEIDKSDKTVNIYGVSKQVTQAKLLNQLLVNEINETAIILANESILPAVLNSLPQHIKNINVSMAYGLHNSQSAQFILCFLQLYSDEKTGSGNTKRYYFKSIIAILAHPFARHFFMQKCEKNTQNFIDTITRYNAPYLSIEQLYKILKPTELETDNLNLLLKTFTNNIEILDAILTFINEYKLYINEGDTLLISEIEEVNLFLETLKNNLNINNRSDSFTFKTIKKFVEQSIKTLSLSYKGEPLKGLQIMGLLETRCLNFKNIILLGCNEGSLPKVSKSSSYIPFDVKRVFNMPMPNENDSVFAYNFYRLLQHSKNVNLVYDTDTESFGGGEKSRFIAQIKQELKLATINEFLCVAGNISANIRQIINIEKSKEIYENLLYYLTQKGLTPTAINAYKQCGLKFYLQYIAKLQSNDEPDEFLGADVLGKLTHKILEILFKPIIGNVLTEKHIEQFAVALEATTIKACKDIDIENKLEDGKNLLVLNMAKTFVRNYLEQEKKNIAHYKSTNAYITILALESELKSTIHIEHNGEDLTVKLSGFADRIDSVAGITRIIDYKTGKVETKELNADSITEIFDDEQSEKAQQLLHYAYLYLKEGKPNNKVQSGIVSFRNYTNGVMNLAINNIDIMQLSHQNEYEELISNLIINMLDETIDFCQTEDLNTCQLCQFANVCNK